MKRLRVLAIIAWFCFVGDQVIASEQGHHLNLTRDGVALSGFDPVSYFSGDPVKGSREISASHGGGVYYFSSRDNQQVFIEHPDRYIPAYGGWCAWAMLEGKTVEVDPERFKIVNGVNYLFYDGFWGNTLKKWNDKARVQGEANLISGADFQWRKLTDK